MSKEEVMLTMVATSDPLVCMFCGSAEMVLAYQAPVYVFATKGEVKRVVVADEEVEFEGRVWCRRCGETVNPNTEPWLGDWPAWQVGW